jgi:hypothetical protein
MQKRRGVLSEWVEGGVEENRVSRSYSRMDSSSRDVEDGRKMKVLCDAIDD